MKHATALFLALALTPVLPPTAGASARAATLVVATRDSSKLSKETADFVADGEGDQEEIYQAIQALPAVGGTVLLTEGTFDIRKVKGELGGLIVNRSNVTLAGQGASTKLVQAPGQNTNVIRILGSGVGHITIRDLYVDANRDQNPHGEGDPNVSHDRFEYCGIKAYCARPGSPRGDDTHDITIRNTHVLNSRRLGIMLEGPNMRVLDNVLGNAGSDAVEILTGPGQIRGNYVKITGRTHVAIGTDRANSIIMANNIVHIAEGGDLDIGFRSWAKSERHVISDNVLTVDPGGKCSLAMDIRGFGTTVSGNTIHASTAKQLLKLRITAGNAIVHGNVLENVIIEIDDQSEVSKPVLVKDNVLENSRIDHRKGRLITK